MRILEVYETNTIKYMHLIVDSLFCTTCTLCLWMASLRIRKSKVQTRGVSVPIKSFTWQPVFLRWGPINSIFVYSDSVKVETNWQSLTCQPVRTAGKLLYPVCRDDQATSGRKHANYTVHLVSTVRITDVWNESFCCRSTKKTAEYEHWLFRGSVTWTAPLWQQAPCSLARLEAGGGRRGCFCGESDTDVHVFLHFSEWAPYLMIRLRETWSYR